MKVLKKEQLLKRKQVLNTQCERRILEEFDHPFLCTLHFAFQTQDKLYMVMDFFAGGELFFHLKKQGKFSEKSAQLYAAETILALDALHSQNIIYRDLKPENLLLDEVGHICLTDFGLAKQSNEHGMLKSLCGTPEYLPPEIIQARPEGYSKAIDYWSLGTMLFEFLTGLPPFYSTNLKQMYEKILTAKLTFPQDGSMSAECQSFLSGLLTRDPTKRLGFGPNGIKDIKSHPWFAGMNWDEVYNKKIVPAYKPENASKTQANNVDEQFRRAPVVDTPAGPAGQLQNRVHFPDFTYRGNADTAPANSSPNGGDDWERV